MIRESHPKYLPAGPNFLALYNVALQSIADNMYIQYEFSEYSIRYQTAQFGVICTVINCALSQTVDLKLNGKLFPSPHLD